MWVGDGLDMVWACRWGGSGAGAGKPSSNERGGSAERRRCIRHHSGSGTAVGHSMMENAHRCGEITNRGQPSCRGSAGFQ